MAKPGQSSFRRFLLSRLLLLSVPVLLAGVYVTYRKARSILLETARQNLTESAVRQGESIQKSIIALQANLVTASESGVLKSASPQAYQGFVKQLAQQLPTQIQCVQLRDLTTEEVVASTCRNELPIKPVVALWPQSQTQLLSDPSKVYVTALLPEKSSTAVSSPTNRSNTTSQLKLLLSAPVYNSVGQLRYALMIQSALIQPERAKPGLLTGYPVIINQKERRILAHPHPERVGKKIDQEADAKRLEAAVDNALAGEQRFQHLFSFEKNGVELLAGYTAIPSPITAEVNQKWVILAVTPLQENALYRLKEIQQVLLVLTCGLIAASFLATLYIARDLARPLEKLTEYALNESRMNSTDRIPQNFKIKELNQLSEALQGMIQRLKAWAEEVETAWKEAQAANQLKNEFLANTSHELRTPLNGIIGCLRLVRDGFCDDREEELDFLKRADDAAIHLLGIINDVLDIARIEAGKLTVEIEPVDLRQLLDEVINLQVVPIQQKGLQFNTTELHEVIAVRADPAKLKQVLLNIVGNAVKFTDSGSITISTRIEEVKDTGQEHQESANSDTHGSKPDGNSSQVVVTVQDTGIGIDPDQQHKLFRPFVMVDGSTTRKCGGTGLGLAISRNLMEMMGGSITLFSEGNGKGTTVEMSLPRIEASLLNSEDSQKSDDKTQTAVDDTDGVDFNGAITKKNAEV
ncbi:MAG: sensor histidine kinase [Coleofasciculus sp. S288]|nr:sensor histidine kinase [Coleofasciculus sp. S288]